MVFEIKADPKANKEILDFDLQLEREDTSFPTLQILDNDGKIVDKDLEKKVGLSDEQLVQLMKNMVLSRTLNDRSVKLAKQGRLGFFGPTAGQEASQLASSFAFDQEKDWIIAGYRDIPQLVMKGWPISKAFLWSRGHQQSGDFSEVGGRGWFPQIIIGAQYVEAAGIGLGLKKNGEDAVAYTYTGDGGTSQGDFYEGMNFAGKYQANVVFFAQNNGYAISTPRPTQTATKHLAAKGWAAGLPSVSVDGMDPLAVYLVAKQAREWAASGKGPVFIETLTNRFGPHSMSGDDPLRYRQQKDIDEWLKFDPLIRFRKYLGAKKLWSEEIEAAYVEEANAQIDEAIKTVDNIEKQKISDFIRKTVEVPGQAAQEQIDKYESEGK